MLIAAERLQNAPVMSLQTGSQLARTKRPVIDPRSLTIIAYELEGHGLDQNSTFLMISDIRELSNLGLIVDSNDEFVGVEEIVHLKEVYDFHFELPGKVVQDKSGHKLGKVVTYSVEPESFLIKQLTVRRTLLKSFTDTELLIDRTQIHEVTDTTITIVNDEREPTHVKRAAQTFTNPFRPQHAQPERIERT